MSELRECPFCGSTPSVHPVELGKPNQYTASCDNTKCPAGPFVVETGEGQAVAAWNTRPADAVREVARALLEADEALWGYAASHTDMTGAGWQSLREQFDARLADLRAALAQDGRG